MLDHLTRLFAYDHWASSRWLERLREIPGPERRTWQVFCHVLASKKAWMQRLEGTYDPSEPLWPELTPEAAAALLEENRAAYERYLAALSSEDLPRPIAYQNSRGEAFETPRRDVLAHVLTHGSYHRGQIAAAVRRQGEEPVNTDYITYVRLFSSQ